MKWSEKKSSTQMKKKTTLRKKFWQTFSIFRRWFLKILTKKQTHKMSGDNENKRLRYKIVTQIKKNYWIKTNRKIQSKSKKNYFGGNSNTRKNDYWYEFKQVKSN